MKQTKNIQGFGMILILILLLGLTISAIGWKTYQQFKNNLGKKTVDKQVLVRRSIIPNIIVRATTAKTIDVSTGKVITAANVFTYNDQTIYLALGLNTPKVGTRIDYIRYLNGRYVDHGSVKITQPNTSNLTFDWSISPILGSRPDGKYKVATYANAILEKRVNYTVTKNKLTSISVEEAVPSDSDYQLSAITND